MNPTSNRFEVHVKVNDALTSIEIVGSSLEIRQYVVPTSSALLRSDDFARSFVREFLSLPPYRNQNDLGEMMKDLVNKIT